MINEKLQTKNNLGAVRNDQSLFGVRNIERPHSGRREIKKFHSRAPLKEDKKYLRSSVAKSPPILRDSQRESPSDGGTQDKKSACVERMQMFEVRLNRGFS